MMIINKRFATAAVVITLALSLSACSNMSKRDRNTAIGAGAGAVGGAVLTDGSALGTLGGAAVGGIIGHQVGK
ncbi:MULTISPECIES: osmotically-inducible lipoprotein OsmB [unclassified Serratia (in: enterobacteria)]|uniref:osmotically-inducible lipoprotein OsmB n=1 Tax=unclassified Serratia (in: enterobacteria) TaxID=2647522 RepID=UPI0004694DB7|nr:MULTISPECIES: osmotically-inducible lipoprotein OsmB [unclassified Serratia (in: enterobacteria)]